MKILYYCILAYCVGIIYALIVKDYIDFIAAVALSVAVVGALKVR